MRDDILITLFGGGIADYDMLDKCNYEFEDILRHIDSFTSREDMDFNDILIGAIDEYRSNLEKAIEEKDKYYGGKISIPKKNGYRHIYKVNKVCRLYDIQKNLCHYFLGNIMISDNAFGFKKDCNYFDFLEEHKNFYGNSNYLRLDIRLFWLDK